MQLGHSIEASGASEDEHRCDAHGLATNSSSSSSSNNNSWCNCVCGRKSMTSQPNNTNWLPQIVCLFVHLFLLIGIGWLLLIQMVCMIMMMRASPQIIFNWWPHCAVSNLWQSIQFHWKTLLKIIHFGFVHAFVNVLKNSFRIFTFDCETFFDPQCTVFVCKKFS